MLKEFLKEKVNEGGITPELATAATCGAIAEKIREGGSGCFFLCFVNQLEQVVFSISRPCGCGPGAFEVVETFEACDLLSFTQRSAMKMASLANKELKEFNINEGAKKSIRGFISDNDIRFKTPTAIFATSKMLTEKSVFLVVRHNEDNSAISGKLDEIDVSLLMKKGFSFI